MLAITGIAGAADNSIYIDQTGDNSTINITQSGYGNVVRGIQPLPNANDNTVNARIYGSNNQLAITQTGSNNRLDLGVQTMTGNGGAGNPTVTYTVTGDNAKAKIDSNNEGTGISESNSIAVNQTGNNSGLNARVLGGENSLSINTGGGDGNGVNSFVNGGNNSQNISLLGGGNNVATVLQGVASPVNNSSVGINLVGASNVFSVTQDGGTVGNQVTVGGYTGGSAMTGSGNSITVSQYGSADNTANLGITGSNNTITANQAAGAASNNVLNLKMNGSGNTVGVSQGTGTAPPPSTVGLR